MSIRDSPVRRQDDRTTTQLRGDLVMTSGYADVNGLHLYYETHGTGSPLVLLHGGMLTIDLDFAGLIPALARKHQVIAVEAQGHGRTADIDRPITPANAAGDIVALLDHLGIESAHVLGHSMGAATTLELAISHGSRVRSIVPISASVRIEGMHPDLMDPSKFATSDRLPTQQDFLAFREAYQRLSPHPEQFDAFLAKQSSSAADLRGWSDEQLAAITAPTLIVQGDHDFVTNEHAALMRQLIPGSMLAILPGTTHMDATRRPDYLLPMLASFLD
jgi:pimeloyl-ACP methyl ester carboxylesterase